MKTISFYVNLISKCSSHERTKHVVKATGKYCIIMTSINPGHASHPDTANH